MKRQIFTLSLIPLSISAFSQKTKVDTLKFRDIEDVRLHKHGNPNKATVFTTKSAVNVMDTPQPISIVTHEIIETQQAKQLSDVIKNVNGVYVASSRGGSQDSFGARGFVFGNDNIFKNGLKVNSGIFPEVTGLERVEVLKGANAMLYGNVGPGGILNMVTKKPRFNFGGSAGMSAGSWNTYKPTVDIYGPMSKNVAFRMDGTYKYAESFRDVVKSQKEYFNPSFLFNLGNNSQLIVEADYLKQHFTPDFGIGSVTDTKTGISTLTSGLSRNQFVGAGWQYQINQQTTTDVIFNHKFNDKWALNAVAGYQNYSKDYYSTERVQWSYDSSKNQRISWKRPLNKSFAEQNYVSGQLNLNGETTTGAVKHKLLFGADADFGNSDTYYFNQPKFYGTSGNLAGTVYLDDPNSWVAGAVPNAEKIYFRRIPTTRFGVYAQDFVEFSPLVKIIAGIRYSDLKTDASKDVIYKTDKNVPVPAASLATHDRAFSPKAGIIITPNDNLTFYGTYTNSFVPNAGLDINHDALKPSVVNQYELGIKKNIIKNRVALNLALYEITNTNTYQTSLTDATLKEYAGKVRSRGAELDITGNPTKELTLIGGVSYNRAVYVATPAGFGYVENQPLVRDPEITANGSVFYKFTTGPKGLILGGTAFYTGGRKAGWNDTKNQTGPTRMIDVKGYVTADFSVGYENKKFLIQAKMGNAFNALSYNVHENYSVNPIAPRNFYFTFTYKL